MSSIESVAEATAFHPASTSSWWKSAVVYQIYPRSFADSNGDGIGDLKGITARLDHLQLLGVDVIWLSPIYQSPQADNGYDISDYRAIDPAFGTMEDFEELLSAVHDRGMKLVMDLVVNHTSDEHPWFKESRSSKDNPKRDWYWWRPARNGTTPGQPGSEPTNWQSFFSGPTWSWDETSQEYYLHLFDRKQPDLNWENPEVRRAVYDMMSWWLDRGVDGFRMDVINFISKDVALPDGKKNGDTYGDGFPYFASGPRIHEFLQEMHQEVFDGRTGEYLTVGEMPGVTWQDAILFTDPARREVDMVFQFEHVSLDHGTNKFDVQPFDAKKLKASLSQWQTQLGQRGWNSLYLNNHDQPRAVSRFGDDLDHWERSAKALATMLHLQRGTPYIYQGEELGMTNYPFTSIDQFRDLESINHYREACQNGADPSAVLASLRSMSRDNARTPMQWDATANAGFTTGTPWLAVNPNHGRVNAERQYSDADSVFNYFQKLIRVRHSLPVVAYGDFTPLLEDHSHVYAYTRAYQNDQLLVLSNLSGQNQQVVVGTEWKDATLILGNYQEASNATKELRPWETRVYSLETSL
ncbi:alpha-glucosidase [Arthrobacter sp. CJ23]|uniref:glycoside hydrolase family 13 protein n=1 Tax=Arthrobacter sp. CJ23 TaxID=2972479 RepID=UPI00215D09C5|nr:alpha-glucosidase [Arthrobacter sp. CJ23]UVJ38633.1 alpha-glucosidase [Arthrobacter sp. CJ23]